MNFKNKPIRKTDNIKKNYTKRPLKLKVNYKGKKTKVGKIIGRIVLILFLLFIIFGALGGLFIYKKYLSDLPSVQELENLDIAESTIIYDRNGNELYKFFKEKRTYVGYDKISKNMINAIVSGEDKRYWENPGVDIIGLIRAFLYGIIGKNEGFGGTSTLTQQLIRNTIIENRRSDETFSEKIERKIKEIYLAYNLSKKLSKSKVLELYLNKISFGSNAFGVEQAAKTFFGKSSSDLSILEGSILASLPKGPSYYSPYNHPDRLLGYLYTYSDSTFSDLTVSGTGEVSTGSIVGEGTPSEKKLINKKDLEENKTGVEKFSELLSSLKAKKISKEKLLLCGLKQTDLKSSLLLDEEGCIVMDYSDLLNFLNSIKLDLGNDNFLEYQIGRKDFILGRMLEDNYITFEEYIESIKTSLGFEFSDFKEDIKMPHFVFYIKELLENKYDYSTELIEGGGLKIYTSIDPELQKKAEELVLKYSKTNYEKYDAQNAAIITIDNKTGDILTMLGGRDYFDKENSGNVNIITSKLQPGSTFKPFVYSLAMYKEEIGTKTPIYDLKTNFPNYTPSNFDGKFMGKMNISTALNNSRNIPAIKMYYLAGGEEEIVKFMKRLGVESLNENGDYGAPLALGTGEMTPLELATAYSVFANMGEKKEINPILKIVDSKGIVIQEKKDDTGEEVISPAQAYIINSVLSDSSSRPDGWNYNLTLKGRLVAAKTGTSTKQYNKGGKKIIYPANLWTAGYTPQYTTVVWAGNTDGAELNYNGSGLDGAGKLWHEYMEYLHEGKEVETWTKPSGVNEVNISSISGLLPSPEDSSNQFLIKSLFLNKPTKYDSSSSKVKVDALCDGKITENTPESAIKEISVFEFHSLRPDYASWENPVQQRVKDGEYKENYPNISNLVTSVNDKLCERGSNYLSVNIGANIKEGDNLASGKSYLELGYDANNNIIKLEVFVGGNKVDDIDLQKKKRGAYVGDITIPSGINGEATLKLRIVDEYYFSKDLDIKVNIFDKDFEKPEIVITNPIDLSIKLYKDEFFNLRGEIKDSSSIRTINIYYDGKLKEVGMKDRRFVYEVKGEDFSLGEHIIKVEAVDYSFNTGFEEIKVEVIEK